MHKLKTVKPKSLLIFSTSLVALLIISPLPFFCIQSGSWISKWSNNFWRRFTSTFLPIPNTICLENNLIRQDYNRNQYKKKKYNKKFSKNNYKKKFNVKSNLKKNNFEEKKITNN